MASHRTDRGVKTDDQALGDLAAKLGAGIGLAQKADIAEAGQRLGLSATEPIAVGDDCAAIPDGNGFLLFAIEGFIESFVETDPWFAGWCGMMVNLSDIAAMGGRPLAVTNAIWSDGTERGALVLDGLRAASETYHVPVAGGHTNFHAPGLRFAVSVLGRAKRLLTSFDAVPGQVLIAAIDLRGRWRDPFPHWDAATGAPSGRLRADLDTLAEIAEAGLATVAKDISGAGLVGTAAMLAETSGVGLAIDLDALPAPADVDSLRWLSGFPSFGFLIAAERAAVSSIVSRFTSRGIACAATGMVEPGSTVRITRTDETATVRDLATAPLLGCGKKERAA